MPKLPKLIRVWNVRATYFDRQTEHRRLLNTLWFVELLKYN